MKMIEFDIDLNVTGPGGSISIDHVGPSAIQLNVSSHAMLRESIRNYDRLTSLLDSEIGVFIMRDYTFFIQIESRTVAYLKHGKLIKGRKVFLLYQYVLAKLGF